MSRSASRASCFRRRFRLETSERWLDSRCIRGLSRILSLRAWCVHGALSAALEFLWMKHRRRLRKLVPDAELIRRRAADESLRELASDYNVAHTTLSRFFERPDVARQLRQARQELRAGERALASRRLAERRLEHEVRRKAM